MPGTRVGEALSWANADFGPSQTAAWNRLDEEVGYSVAREAEIYAIVEGLKLQDVIPEVVAHSLGGVIAKLEMIAGADRDIGDPTDFPWPHIGSVLQDLKAIAGNLPTHRPDRATTRVDVAKHWEAAAKLVAALKKEFASERRQRSP